MATLSPFGDKTALSTLIPQLFDEVADRSTPRRLATDRRSG